MKAKIVLSQDPMADTRSAEEVLALDSKKRLDNLTTKPRNVFLNVNSNFSGNVAFQTGSTQPNGSFWGTNPATFQKFLPTPVAQQKLSKITGLNLNVGSNWYANGFFNLATLPSGNFAIPLYFILGEFNYNITSGSVFTPWVNFRISDLLWDNTNGNFSFVQPVLTKDLTDYMQYRQLVSNFLDFSGSSSFNQKDKITKQQYEAFLNDGNKQIGFSVFADFSGLSGNNLTFANNQVSGNTLAFTLSVEFQYFGNVSAFTPNNI